MKINKVSRNHKHYPKYLLEIPSAPTELYYLGQSLNDYLPAVTIVGSRKHTAYGKEITYRLAYDLAKQGITIVSGLALGIDGIAHQGALDASGRTVAVLGCGLDYIYPPSHRNLAIKLLEKGGTILSEYPEGTPTLKQHFIARNRLVSGLGDMIVVTEAAEASGSLVTASFALDQNKLVGAVPGNVTSRLSAGTNNLIKTGATPVTAAKDILEALGVRQDALQREEVFGDTEEEQMILDLMKDGVTELEHLQARSELEPAIFSQTITMLEIAGKIRPLGAAHWTLR